MARSRKNFPNPSQSHNPFSWTPTCQYPWIIREACHHHNLGFSIDQILKLERELAKFPQQSDNLTPVSVAVWPAGNADDNWSRLNSWLMRQAKIEDVNIGLCMFENRWSLTKDSHRFTDNRSVLRPVIIDIAKNQSIYMNDNGAWEEKSLGIEIIPFLAMNPHIIKFLDYRVLPNIRMPGIRMCENFEPVIGYEDGSFFIKFETV